MLFLSRLSRALVLLVFSCCSCFCLSVLSDNSEYDKLLLQATAIGNRELAKRVLLLGANPNIHGPCLIKKSVANVKGTEKKIGGMTPLMYASRFDDKELVTLLIKQKACVWAIDAEGVTALHHAASRGSVEAVKVLLESGAAVTAQTDKKTTPLHHAATKGYTEVAKLLLERFNNSEDLDVYVNLETSESATALHYAARNGRYAMVKLLLDNGAHSNVRAGTGMTPLHFAVMDGNNDIIRLLVNSGADSTIGDNQGHGVLYYAYISGKIECVKWLINYAQDDGILPFLLSQALFTRPLGKQKQQQALSLLEEALWCEDYEFARWLMSNKIILPETNNSEGSTALHRAVLFPNSEAALAVLLEFAQDIEVRDEAFIRTPLEVALINDNSAAYKLFLAQVSGRTNFAASPGAGIPVTGPFATDFYTPGTIHYVMPLIAATSR